jgi:hypothetical protein
MASLDKLALQENSKNKSQKKKKKTYKINIFHQVNIKIEDLASNITPNKHKKLAKY